MGLLVFHDQATRNIAGELSPLPEEEDCKYMHVYLQQLIRYQPSEAIQYLNTNWCMVPYIYIST